MDRKKLVTVIATAAAVAFATAPLTSTLVNASHHHEKCWGVNACKGKSSCKTANNACKGKNACKGQGYMMKSEKRCKKMGGSMTEPAATT